MDSTEMFNDIDEKFAKIVKDLDVSIEKEKKRLENKMSKTGKMQMYNGFFIQILQKDLTIKEMLIPPDCIYLTKRKVGDKNVWVKFAMLNEDLIPINDKGRIDKDV